MKQDFTRARITTLFIVANGKQFNTAKDKSSVLNNHFQFACTVTEKTVRIKTVRPDRFWMKKWSGRTNIGQPNMVRPDQF